MQKSDWGNAIWFLLHTLAHKLLPNHSREAPNVLGLMVQIATHLPCEECSNHSREMLAELTRHPVRNREHLIAFWLTAHNLVNKRLGKPEFTMKECLEKYEQADTLRVVQHYRQVMGTVRTGERGVADGWRRQRVMTMFDGYLASHAYMYSH